MSRNRIYLPLFFFFLVAAFLACVRLLVPADFVPACFFPNTLSQFFENSGLGPERTIGPDIAWQLLKKSVGGYHVCTLKDISFYEAEIASQAPRSGREGPRGHRGKE
ncbi:MAG: hypothetical protein WD278_15210 [Pirellulales bacterium]